MLLTSTIIPEKTIPPVPLPKPIHMAAAPTIRDIIPIIVKDNLVRPEDIPPANDDITDHVKIGASTNPGQGDLNIETPPSDGGAGDKGIVGPLVKKDETPEDGIVERVEIESTYPGGAPAWQRFLLKNFRAPELTVDEPTTATVVVRFIVDKEGKVSDVEAISGPEILRKEALRVIRLSGKWIPAIQNGRQVKSYKQQPITVILQEQ